MRITRHGGHISIRDRPGPFWALGLFLLAGGVIAVAMPLGLATNVGDLAPWQRLASAGIGLGVGTGAVWWLVRSPGTQVQLDLARRHLRLVRSGVTGRRVRRFGFDDLEGVEIEEGTDSEGGSVCRPVLRLRSGERVYLSELWSHDRAGVQEGLEVVAEACRMPIIGG